MKKDGCVLAHLIFHLFLFGIYSLMYEETYLGFCYLFKSISIKYRPSFLNDQNHKTVDIMHQ